MLITLRGAETRMSNFMGIGPGVPRSPHIKYLKYNVLWLCVPPLSFPFFSLVVAYSKNVLSINASIDSFSAKYVPFGVRKLKFNF